MVKYLPPICLGLLILVVINTWPSFAIPSSEPGNIRTEESPSQAIDPAFNDGLSSPNCDYRTGAWPKRIERILILINKYGLFAIFCLLMLGIAGIPVPDELIMTFAGYLILIGVLRPIPTIVTCCLGSVCGISLSYFLGYAVGTPLVEKYGHILRLTGDKIILVHDWFNRIGKWTLVIGYFIPGVRHLTGFVAGVSQLEILVFSRYAYAGALFWSMTFLSIGFFLGNQWCKIRSHLYLISLLGIVLLLVIILGYAIMRKNQQISKDRVSDAK